MGTQSVPHPEIASVPITPSAVTDAVLHQAKAGGAAACCSPKGDDSSDDTISPITLIGFLALVESALERGAIDAITKRRSEKDIVMVVIFYTSQCFEIMIDTYLSVP
jgi:hypothetical protein